MDTSMIIELVGYLGSVLVVVAMLMPSLVKLRVINTVGAAICLVYSFIIGAYSMVLMNACLITINVYNLIKLSRTEKHFDLVEGEKDDTFMSYILDYYDEDIKNYFPEFELEKFTFNMSYIICCDSVPAGFFLGTKNENGEVDVLLDYSTPAYRDCSVGTYLHSKLPAKGVKKLIYRGSWEKTVPYLQKVGCVQENGVYVKKF